MFNKILLIVNANAGKQEGKRYLYNIINELSKKDCEITVHITQARSEATEITVKKCAMFDAVICCGGDGTLNEVVSGVVSAGCKTPIGYIPAGSTNDFATSVGIQKGITNMLSFLKKTNIYQYDVGMFNSSRYFTYICAFGAFTNVSYSTSQELKNTFGHLAYILEGMKQVNNLPSYHLKVELDDEIIEDNFVFGAVSNSTSVAGLFKLKKEDVKLDDGYFEVMLIKTPQNLQSTTVIISELLNQQYGKEVVLRHAKKIKITSLSPVAWTLDGENGGEHKSVEIENLNKSVSYWL